MSKCAQKLAPRRGALAASIYLLVLGIVRWIKGVMPASDSVQWAPKWSSIEMPFILPRLADVLVVFVAATLASWLIIDFDRSGPAKLLGFDSGGDFHVAEACALALGFLGAVCALFGGLWWVIGCAVLASLVFNWLYFDNRYSKANYPRRWERNMTRGIIVVSWFGPLVMFFFLTPFTGLMPAATSALAALAVIISTGLVVAGLCCVDIGLFRILKDPFKRAFMVCDSGESSEEPAAVQT